MKKQTTYVMRIALAGAAGLCAGLFALPNEKGEVPPAAIAAPQPVVEPASKAVVAPVQEPIVVAAAEPASNADSGPAPKPAPKAEPQSKPAKPAAPQELEAVEVKPTPVQAAPLPGGETPKAASRWDEDQAVAAVEKYFRSSETLRATFTQFAPDGTRSTGVLSLKRPGRVRFDYDFPSPLLIIADGVWITLADREMDTVDRYPVSATPLGVILQDDKSLRKEAIVTGFYQDQDRFELVVRARNNPGLGRLSLKLTKEPLTLDGWAVEDAQGLVTEIRLANMKTGMTLDPALFHISDIKKTRDR
ncbi:MAG: outer-membrane lipoprotein carrier protein LolA [Alphaproteobacteria bacterium]